MNTELQTVTSIAGTADPEPLTGRHRSPEEMLQLRRKAAALFKRHRVQILHPERYANQRSALYQISLDVDQPTTNIKKWFQIWHEEGGSRALLALNNKKRRKVQGPVVPVLPDDLGVPSAEEIAWRELRAAMPESPKEAAC